jgi:hypothetical protein
MSNDQNTILGNRDSGFVWDSGFRAWDLSERRLCNGRQSDIGL